VISFESSEREGGEGGEKDLLYKVSHLDPILDRVEVRALVWMFLTYSSEEEMEARVSSDGREKERDSCDLPIKRPSTPTQPESLGTAH